MDTNDVTTPEKEADAPDGSTTQQFREQTATVRDDIRQLGRVTRDMAQEKLDDARKAASDMVDQSRRRAGDIEDQVIDFVREKPVKSMLIAAGVGLVLGMVWSRR